MELRDLFLFTATFGCMSVAAQSAHKLEFVYGADLKPRITNVDETKHMSLGRLADVRLKAEKPNFAPAAEADGGGDFFFSAKEAEAVAARAGESGGKIKLDSVIGTNADGTTATRMYFRYNSQGKEIERLNSYWNAYANRWDEPVETYEYEWTDYGYILSESVIGYGQGKKVEYVYNDDRLATQQTIYALGSDNTWTPSSKGEYTYDDRGNIIEEYIYAWDGTRWVYSNHNTATWDSKNRQTSYVGMVWNGASWGPGDKATYVWFDGPKDPDYTEGDQERMTFRGWWLWRDDDWFMSEYDYNEFNEDGRLSGQGKKCYNPVTKNWGGGYDYGNGVVGKTYDLRIYFDDHRFPYYKEEKECMLDSTVWVTTSVSPYNWVYDDEGNREGLYQLYLYRYNDRAELTDTIFNQQVYYGYNAQNKKTWVLQMLPDDDGVMQSDYEEKYGWDENGNLLYKYDWSFKDGKRVPSLYTEREYDADGNCTSILSMAKDGGGMVPMGAPSANKAPATRGAAVTDEDKEGWSNSSLWEYSYKDGVLYKTMGWRWQSGDWAPNSGSETFYDWDTPESELAVPNGWTDPYKIESLNDYTGDGKGGWNTAKRSYYWTPLVATGIQGVTDGGDIRVYPTMVTDCLHVEADGDVKVDIYGINGTSVMRTNAKTISMSGVPSGVYVVSVNGYKVKIVKK